MALFEQLPADLNEEIARALSNKLSLSELNFLRLVNKTWRGAVEGGQFGHLGRLLRPGLPKLALLFRNDATNCGESELDTRVAVALPAIGIVDEATWRVSIFPLSTTGPLFVPKQTHAVLLGRSIFSFTNLRPKTEVSGFKEVRPTDMSSYNLVSKRRRVYETVGRREQGKTTSWFHYLHVINTTKLDKHRFVVFGHRFVRSTAHPYGHHMKHRSTSKVQSWYLALIFDSRSAMWQLLPPLPTSVQSSLHDVRSFCYVSQGRIWISHNLQLYSIASQAGTVREWRREKPSVPFRCLEAPEAASQVLAPLKDSLRQEGRWKVALRNGDRPELLELPLPRKGLAWRSVRGAVNLKRGLLVMSSEEAYLDGKELTYVWQRGAGVVWSPEKCRVLWASAFEG